ncbi:hypothetical protein, partial [Kocuria rosea]|uniref:hypothetical protein n=1 Tax=Kocuria rosea TaxID=1275 RepID=UPI001C92C201
MPQSLGVGVAEVVDVEGVAVGEVGGEGGIGEGGGEGVEVVRVVVGVVAGGEEVVVLVEEVV